MGALGKSLRTGAAAALMLATITTGARGFVGVGMDPFASSALGTGGVGLQLKGKVVCAGCSLAEAREARHDQWSNHLYRLAYRQKQVVMEVEWVSDSLRWYRLITTPQIRLRGEDSLFEKLAAEENLFREIAVSGILSPSRTLDVHEVTVLE